MNLWSFQFCLQVHAQSGDCSETQYSSQTSLYTRTQWQDLPLLGDERCLPDRVSPRREGPAAPAPAQPLSGEEKGDHKETPLLHWWDILMWRICAFYGSTLQICLGVSPVDWPRRWPSPFICFVSRFQLAFEWCFLSCHSPVVYLHPDVCQLPIFALIGLFNTQIQMGNSAAPPNEFPFS